MWAKKTILQFKKDGTYIRTIPSLSICSELGDENGRFCKQSVSRCARGIRNTYRDYIWIYEEDYSQELLNKRVEISNSRFDTIKKAVVCLDNNGRYVGRYNSVTEASANMFVDKISLHRHLKGNPKHKTCAGYIWKYETDYLMEVAKNEEVLNVRT